jgi:endonuclease/exonuclease/phosphatase family metal-dependent hydrolase
VDETAALASLGAQSAFASNFLCPFVPIPVTDPMGKVDSGVMTLSNLSVSEAARLSLPSPFRWPISTCNLKRCLLATRIPVEGGKELVVVNLHLEAFDDGAGKAAQTKVLADFLTKEYESGNYVVAGGDFNQWLPGVDQTKYPARTTGAYIPGNVDRSILPEGWTFAADDSTPTCRSGDKPYDAANPENYFYVIDGFILSPNVSLKSVRALPLGFQFSDHNPVRIEFELG